MKCCARVYHLIKLYVFIAGFPFRSGTLHFLLLFFSLLESFSVMHVGRYRTIYKRISNIRFTLKRSRIYFLKRVVFLRERIVESGEHGWMKDESFFNFLRQNLSVYCSRLLGEKWKIIPRGGSYLYKKEELSPKTWFFRKSIVRRDAILYANRCEDLIIA